MDMRMTVEEVNRVLETLTTARNELVELHRELKDCRNELCLRCGSYKQAHLGACDGCKWRDMG